MIAVSCKVIQRLANMVEDKPIILKILPHFDKIPILIVGNPSIRVRNVLNNATATTESIYKRIMFFIKHNRQYFMHDSSLATHILHCNSFFIILTPRLPNFRSTTAL